MKKVSVFIPVVMLPLGIWLGYRTFEDRSGAEIWAAVTGLPTARLLLAVACVAGSYFCLSLFDTLAIRYVGKKVAYPKIALTSFISLGIGHTVGVAVLSSGALRYRMYSWFGLTGADVAKVILMCAITVGLGLIGLCGISLVLRPNLSLADINIAPTLVRAIGAACLALPMLYVALAALRKAPITIRGHKFSLPDVRIAVGQVIIGTVNFACVAGALYNLLAGAATYSETVTAYVLANLSALVSHVPGGIGVLEYVISKLVSHGDVLGALIAFRVLYFLVPLALAICLLVTTEIVRWRLRKL